MSTIAVESRPLRSSGGNISDSPSASLNGKDVKRLPSSSSTPALSSNSNSSTNPISPEKVQKVEKAFLKRFSTGQRIAIFTTFALIALVCAFLIFFCPPVGVFTLGLVPTYWGSIAAMLWISSSLSGKKVTSWIKDQLKDEVTNQARQRPIIDSGKKLSDKSSSLSSEEITSELSVEDERKEKISALSVDDREEEGFSEETVADSDSDVDVSEEMSDIDRGNSSSGSEEKDFESSGLFTKKSPPVKRRDVVEPISRIEIKKSENELSVDDERKDKSFEPLVDDLEEEKISDEKRSNTDRENSSSDSEEEDFGLSRLFTEESSSANSEEVLELVTLKEMQKPDSKFRNDLIALGPDLNRAMRQIAEVLEEMTSTALEKIEAEKPLQQEAAKVSQAIEELEMLEAIVAEKPLERQSLPIRESQVIYLALEEAPQRTAQRGILRQLPLDSKIDGSLKLVPPIQGFSVASSASQAFVSSSILSEILLNEGVSTQQEPHERPSSPLGDQINTPVILPQEELEIIPIGLFKEEPKALEEITKVDRNIQGKKQELVAAQVTLQEALKIQQSLEGDLSGLENQKRIKEVGIQVQKAEKRVKEIETYLDIAEKYRKAIISHMQALADKKKISLELQALKDAGGSWSAIRDKARELVENDKREREVYDYRFKTCKEWLDIERFQRGNNTTQRQEQSSRARHKKSANL